MRTAAEPRQVLVVYHLLVEAEAAIDSRPTVVRMRIQLPCDAGAPASARQ